MRTGFFGMNVKTKFSLETKLYIASTLNIDLIYTAVVHTIDCVRRKILNVKRDGAAF